MSDAAATPWAEAAAKVAREGWPKLPEKVNVYVDLMTYDGQTHADAAVFAHQLTAQIYTQLAKRIGTFGFGYQTGYPTPSSRNRSILHAKQRGVHFLLMLDNDMAFDARAGDDPDALEFLPTALMFALAQPAPVFVGAPYCGGPPAQEVMVFKNREVVPDMPGAQGKRVDKFTRDEAAAAAGIGPVAAIGTGCLLMDLRAFDVLPPPWFYYEDADPPWNTELKSSEDVVTTRNMNLIGVDQYCAWPCWAHHHKRMEIGKPLAFPSRELPRAVHEAWKNGAKPTLAN